MRAMGLPNGLPRARRPRARPGRVKPAARPYDFLAGPGIGSGGESGSTP
jgi:hypothetical protein